MSQINIRNLSNENDDGSPEIVGISTFSATSFFVPPKGTTKERPSDCEPGSIRFNTDTANLEYFRGKTIGWSQFELINPNLGGGTGSNTGVGVRGLFAGGFISPTGTARTNIIDFITISTLGNAQDFGDRTHTSDTCAGAASKTRGVIAGGYAGSETNIIEFVTIASLGDALDFGDLPSNRRNRDGCGDTVRGLFGGGYPQSAQIDYITFESLGNAIDFGDLTVVRFNTGALSSSTRAVFAGGDESPSSPVSDVMDFVTIRTLGNATDFGDLAATGTGGQSATSNSTRGLIGISNSNTINFITIATLGNAQDFGDASHNLGSSAAAGSPTRAVFAGGGASPAPLTNSMSFVEILTTGNGLDFGDLTDGRQNFAGFSNGHGGL